MDLVWRIVEVVRQMSPAVTFLVTVATWILAHRLRKEAKRRDSLAAQLIRITVRSETGKVVLPYAPRRSQLTRAELLGVLGMSAKSGRFALDRLSEVFSGGLFERVLAGKLDQLEIPCSDEELEQFWRETT